jgi:hypothetical protein
MRTLDAVLRSKTSMQRCAGGSAKAARDQAGVACRGPERADLSRTGQPTNPPLSDPAKATLDEGTRQRLSVQPSQTATATSTQAVSTDTTSRSMLPPNSASAASATPAAARDTGQRPSTTTRYSAFPNRYSAALPSTTASSFVPTCPCGARQPARCPPHRRSHRRRSARARSESRRPVGPGRWRVRWRGCRLCCWCRSRSTTSPGWSRTKSTPRSWRAAC